MSFAIHSTVLVLFCKRPALGIGKQRIARDLDSQRALAVSELLLDAAVEDLRAWPGPVVIAPAEASDRDWAAALLPEAQVVDQGEGNLGQRLNKVDEELRAAGAKRVVYIGSDAPGLNGETLRNAAAALDESCAVLIPAEDGGVTLLGSRCPWPALEALPWETSELGTALQDCCRDAGWRVTCAGVGRDIDTWSDLRRELPRLNQDARPARQALAAWITEQQSLSVIVPVYHDLPALRRLLKRLTAAAPPVDEVIVVDGAGRSDCHDLCAHFGARYLESRPSRGVQLNAGAQLASTALLWFLHADSEPPANAVELIRERIAEGHRGGYFRFSFAGKRGWQQRLLAAVINLRARFGVPYGDQGLFMTRGAYFDAGGFAAQPLFEEVRLVKSLRRRGPFAALHQTIGVAPRRWERDGWARRTLHNRLLALAYGLGVPAERLARAYRRPSDHQATHHPSAAR